MKIAHFSKTSAFTALFSLCSIGLFPSVLQAAEQKQDLEQVRQEAEHFLTKETTGLPGIVKIKIGAIDSRLNLANCVALEAFTPPGSKLWGKTTVGIRCAAPQPWTMYVTGTVQVWSDYFITSHTIAQGQLITDSDISKLNGDLTALPNGLITQADQAVGRIAAVSLFSGLPLRQDVLKTQQMIVQGQTIQLMSNGTGFKVSTEAQALNNANSGQLVRVKTASGQVITGLAKAAGLVEVNN